MTDDLPNQSAPELTPPAPDLTPDGSPPDLTSLAPELTPDDGLPPDVGASLVAPATSRSSRGRRPSSADIRPHRPEYRGEELDPARGPGLGCFWFQAIILAFFLVLIPIGVNLNWPYELLAVLLFTVIGLLLLTGQTVIFLLRLVAADRRSTGRRRPVASATRTVGELEDALGGAQADRAAGSVPEIAGGDLGAGVRGADAPEMGGAQAATPAPPDGIVASHAPNPGSSPKGGPGGAGGIGGSGLTSGHDLSDAPPGRSVSPALSVLEQGTTAEVDGVQWSAGAEDSATIAAAPETQESMSDTQRRPQPGLATAAPGEAAELAALPPAAAEPAAPEPSVPPLAPPAEEPDPGVPQ